MGLPADQAPRRTPWRARAATLIGMAGVAIGGAYLADHAQVTTEITHFLPSDDDRDLANLSTELTRSDLNRSLTLTLAGPDRDTVIAASKALGERLSAHPERFATVRNGPPEALDEAFHALYFPRRFLTFSDRPDPLAARFSDESLRAAARELKDRLAGPAGSFIKTLAPGDPWLGFLHHLEGMRAAEQAGLEVIDGQFVTSDGRHGVIFLATQASPFDTAVQAEVQSVIQAELAAVNATHGGGLSLEQSGVHRFALHSEASIKSDITRISVFSLVGVLVFMLVLFGSPRYFILSSVPLGVGFVAAFGATQAIFGSVHGLTLAFGSTTIGVAIDYVSHYFNHHVLRPHPDGPFASLRAIAPGLFIAAATTIAGLAGVAWTGFPGVREIGVFTSIGVLASLAATPLFLPPWLPTRPVPTRLHRALADLCGRLLAWMRGSKLLLSGVPLAAIGLSALAFSQLTWLDDVRALNSLDPALLAEDERVRDRVSRVDSGRFVIAFGDDEETALARNDAVFQRMSQAMEVGEVEHVRSLHWLLWSAALQRQSLLALRSADRLVERTLAQFEAEGFVGSAFEPFRKDLSEDPAPLTYRDLAESPLGPMVAPFRVSLGDRVAFITYTRGADLERLRARLQGLDGVLVFDQAEFMSRAYGKFRTRTLELVALGLVAVLGMVFLRYRRLSLTFAAVLPAVLASCAALSVVVLWGEPPNLMHLTALLLVLSMGEDYGVFMVETYTGREEPAEALVSILVACLTTVLSFGLLAMSENPAMRALGVVTALGVFFSMLLAPMAWLLLSKPR
jgi:predicted exporter